MARRQIAGARVLITGASSGIGTALARLAARRGARVALVARSQDALDRIVKDIEGDGGEAIAVPGDVTLPEDRHRMLATVTEKFGGLDILVNNAGIGATGHFYKASEDRLRQIMEVNFFAPAELIRLAVPLLEHGTPRRVAKLRALGNAVVPQIVAEIGRAIMEVEA